MKKALILFSLFPLSVSAQSYTGPIVKDIFLGPGRTCALLENEEVRCWGKNDGFFKGYGLDNYDPVGNRPEDMGGNTPKLQLDGKKVIDLAMAKNEICAIHPQYEATCWRRFNEPKPLRFTRGPSRIKKIAFGGQHKCGIFEAEESTDEAKDIVACWGQNGLLQIPGPRGRNKLHYSIGNKVEMNFPSSAGNPIDVKVESIHSCVLFDSGQVRCWGSSYHPNYNKSGMQGTESPLYNKAFDAIDFGSHQGVPLKAIKLIGAPETDRFCAQLDDQSFKCWGKNSYGELGIGSTLNKGASIGSMGNFLPPLALGQGVLPVQLAVGGNNSCMLTFNGTVKCWGVGDYGVNGQEDKKSFGHSPETIGDYLPYVYLGRREVVKKVVLGGESAFANQPERASHACALLQSGGIKCWGNNFNGQLGLGIKDKTVGTQPYQMGENLPYVRLN